MLTSAGGQTDTAHHSAAIDWSKYPVRVDLASAVVRSRQPTSMTGSQEVRGFKSHRLHQTSQVEALRDRRHLQTAIVSTICRRRSVTSAVQTPPDSLIRCRDDRLASHRSSDAVDVDPGLVLGPDPLSPRP